MSDVLLFQTNDGGDVEFVGGQPTMHDGFDVAVYLSCWGGNEQDPGLPGDTSKMWWGSIGEPLDRQYRSELQYLLRDLPVTAANRQLVEDAADRDLNWMRTALSATVTIAVSIPARNTWLIEIEVVVGDQTYKPAFERKGPNA
jgi:phage gp46-like protein